MNDVVRQWFLENPVAIQIACLLLLIVIIPLAVRSIANIILKKYPSNNFKYIYLIKTGIYPVSVLIISLIVRYTLVNLVELDNAKVVLQISVFTAFFIWAWIFIQKVESKIISNIHDSSQDKQISNLDSLAITGISKIIKLLIITLYTISMLRVFNIDLAAILAVGGVGGMVVGFAAKDLIANLFGGMVIHIEKPFKIGQLIRCDNPTIFGVVENIGWRRTVVRTLDDKTPLFIPNQTFMNANVENCSVRTHRGFKTSVGVTYDDIEQVLTLTKKLRENFCQLPEVDKKEIYVNFEEYGDSCLSIKVWVFTRQTDYKAYLLFKEKILWVIHEEVKSLGMEFAFPTHTLYLKKEENK